MSLFELEKIQKISTSGDVIGSAEVPRSIVKLELSEVMTGVRLGMHTDTMGNLLRVLSDIPEASDLRFEARVLTLAQRHELDRNRAYRFYMSGRVVRSGNDLGIVLEAGFNPTVEDVSRWASSPFSPSTLSRRIGYQVSYIDLSGRMPGNPSDQHMLTGAIGGCNELNIGSDNVDPLRLAEIAEEIKRRLAELDPGVSGVTILPILPSNNFYKICQNPIDKNTFGNIIINNNQNNSDKYLFKNIITKK